MNKEAVKILNDITKLEVEALTDFQIAFLRARQDYLTDEQKEKYMPVLNPEKHKKTAEYEALKERAKELGIEPHKKKADELKKLIEEAEKKQTENKE